MAYLEVGFLNTLDLLNEIERHASGISNERLIKILFNNCLVKKCVDKECILFSKLNVVFCLLFCITSFLCIRGKLIDMK